MDSRLVTNSAFIPGTYLQYAWDSVSMGELKRCPRSYYHSIICGWTTSRQRIDLEFGIFYASSLEHYHHALSRGITHDEALRIAIRFALTATWDTTKNRPWSTLDSNKNRWTLIRTIIDFCDQFNPDPVATLILENGKPAVELSFRLELDYKATPEQPFLLCGHYDRVGVFNGDTYILDNKTTKHTLNDDYFQQFSPDNQFSGYVFAGSIIYNIPIKGIICDAAQIMVESSRFMRQPILRTPDQLDEWYKDFGIYLEMARGYAAANYWPMNEKSCFRCQYRSICSKPPAVREQWLKADFVKREWNPLAVRGPA